MLIWFFCFRTFYVHVVLVQFLHHNVKCFKAPKKVWWKEWEYYVISDQIYSTNKKKRTIDNDFCILLQTYQLLIGKSIYNNFYFRIKRVHEYSFSVSVNIFIYSYIFQFQYFFFSLILRCHCLSIFTLAFRANAVNRVFKGVNCLCTSHIFNELFPKQIIIETKSWIL